VRSDDNAFISLVVATPTMSPFTQTAKTAETTKTSRVSVQKMLAVDGQTTIKQMNRPFG
jgi:hypothetical protein